MREGAGYKLRQNEIVIQERFLGSTSSKTAGYVEWHFYIPHYEGTPVFHIVEMIQYTHATTSLALTHCEGFVCSVLTFPSPDAREEYKVDTSKNEHNLAF